MSNETTHYQGRYLTLLERDHWEYATRSNAHAVAVIVAVTPDDDLLLVEQYRRPVDARVIELPAGLVGDQGDPNENVLHAAGRELIEETGFEASDIELIMKCPSSAGMTDEIVSFVRARGLKQVGDGGGDDSEDIEVHRIPLCRVDSWLLQQQSRGRLLDPKIYTALHWLSQEAK
jgi:ADP-ribose pyrophosphatase